MKLTLTRFLKWDIIVDDALLWDPLVTGEPPNPESALAKGAALLEADMERLIILGDV